MIHFFKSLFPNNYKRNIKEQLGVPTFHKSLERLKQIGFRPQHVIDIGAYQGDWTREFLEVFPKANVLMMEAQASKEVYLKKVSATFPNTKYHIGLLSEKEGEEMVFYENETASSVIPVHKDNPIKKITTTVDTVIENIQFPLPDFLKLDVQGFELEVLKGATKALQHATFCLLEVTFLDIDNTPVLFDVLKFMDERNFQAYDLFNYMRRPSDQALFQADLLLINKDSQFIRDIPWTK